MQSYQDIVACAHQGNSESQYQLGLMYELGAGVEKSEILAFAWYQQSANQNHAKAQYNLGIFYALAKGVEKDIRQAKYWIKKAHDNGYSGASIF